MSRNLSGSFFIISQVTILVAGIAFIGWLYFFLNRNEASSGYLAGGPVTNEPASLTLELNSPEDDLLVFKDEVLISGKTAGNHQVLISSEASDLVLNAKGDGGFSADFPLDEGVNNITVAVFDERGDTRSIQKTVYYSKEKI